MPTDQPTLLWPSHRPLLPETPTTTLSKNSRHPRHRGRPTLCPPEAAKLPTKRLRKRRKNIDVWINSGTRVEKTLAPPLPLAITAGLGKTCSRLRASTVIRKNTTQGTALSLERMCQKTSIGLSNLYSND